MKDANFDESSNSPTEQHLNLTDIEIKLATLPLSQPLEEMRRGYNQVYLARFSPDLAGVFKPGSGEQPLRIVESRQALYLRERAAYIVSKASDFNLVPPTVIRSFPGLGEGSLQLYIADPKQNANDLKDQNKLSRLLYVVSLFDYFCWNKDRKSDTILIKNDENIVIDNSVSFDRWVESRISMNLVEHVLGAPAPDDVITRIIKFNSDEARQAELEQKLNELLPKKAVEAAFARFHMVANLVSSGFTIKKLDFGKFIYLPEG